MQSGMFYVQQALGKEMPSREEARDAVKWLSRAVWFYDKMGDVKLSEVLEAFRYAHRRHGIRFFVIDSLMTLGIPEDDLDAQKEAAKVINSFVQQHDVHVFLVAHPRKQKDDDAVLNKHDVKGSGGITDLAHNIMIVWRNRKKEKLLYAMRENKESETDIRSKERGTPDAILSIGKQRNDQGQEPEIKLWFKADCRQYYGHYKPDSVNFLAPSTTAPAPAPTEVQQELDENVPF